MASNGRYALCTEHQAEGSSVSFFNAYPDGQVLYLSVCFFVIYLVDGPSISLSYLSVSMHVASPVPMHGSDAFCDLQLCMSVEIERGKLALGVDNLRCVLTVSSAVSAVARRLQINIRSKHMIRDFVMHRVPCAGVIQISLTCRLRPRTVFPHRGSCRVCAGMFDNMLK